MKRSIMISDFGNGGLRMIDLKSFNKALKKLRNISIKTII